MTFRILLSPPDVSELEGQRVLDAVRSGWVAPAGPELELFESEVADRIGVGHAVALSSGTAALHLALVSWGVGPGDVVPVSTLTFAATVNAIRYVGAEPFFVDCDPTTGNISPTLLESAMSTLDSRGGRVPAVVSVDLFGKCVDYDAISELAREHDARLLADAAESVGARFGDSPAGALGDAAALSFNGNKVMTTSGGGMLLTDDGEMARHVRKLSTQAREPVPHYEHTEIGYNYRLSNILAALGRAQLSRLDEMLAARRRWREGYKTALNGIPGVSVLGGDSDAQDNCWVTVIVIEPGLAGTTSSDVAKHLEAAGIESRPVWKPMHRQPAFAKFDAILDGSADQLFAAGLVLPSGSGMSVGDFDEVVDSLVDALRS